MTITLRLTADEHHALQRRAEREGISIHEAARRAVRAYTDKDGHRERVAAVAQRVRDGHAEALERLGE